MAVPATWPYLPVTCASCALVPARCSYPFATRARSLFLLNSYSYSPGYSFLGVLLPVLRAGTSPLLPVSRAGTSTPRHGHCPCPWPVATPSLLVSVPACVLVTVRAHTVSRDQRPRWCHAGGRRGWLGGSGCAGALCACALGEKLERHVAFVTVVRLRPFLLLRRAEGFGRARVCVCSSGGKRKPAFPPRVRRLAGLGLSGPRRPQKHAQTTTRLP